MKAIIAATMVSMLLAATSRAEDAADKALAAQQGTWTILSFTSDGNDLPLSQIVTWQRIVKGTHVAWKDGDQAMVELDIKIDPTQSPVALDSTIATGDAKGQTLRAIYAFEDNILRVCFSPPGEPRPTQFTAAKDSGQLMYTAKRLSP
jgi:uncharacterized protein (TIGR03067 family)